MLLNSRYLLILGLICMFSLTLLGCSSTGLTRLDSGGQYAYTHPTWASDSSKIAYTRYEVYAHPWTIKSDTGELFVMDETARQAIQLTHDDVQDSSPTWSPDGQQIAYVREVTIYDAQTQSLVITNSLHVIRLDGYEVRELFVCPFTCGSPTWSPSGERIAFSMASAKWTPEPDDYEPPFEIYVIDVDGTGLFRLTEGQTHAVQPQWSPDGRQIVFRRSEENPIRVIDLQSGVETTFNLKDLFFTGTPTWSPDQSGIVFTAEEPSQGRVQIFLLNIADGLISPLFDDDFELPAGISEPDWSPDGTRLVFSSYHSELYVIDMSGVELP